MMRRSMLVVFAAVAGLTACANLSSVHDEADDEFQQETDAHERRVREDRTHSELASLESALADYLKAVGKIPDKLEKLAPKYIAAIPTMEIPECGPDTDRVQNYPVDILRDGEIDGTRIEGRGGWGYVHTDKQVVIFVDCLKPDAHKRPWYKLRGAF